MATYAVQTVDIIGTTPVYSNVSVSDKIHYNGERSFLIVKNGSGASINVTVVVPGAKYGQNVPDVVIAVPAGAERWIGTFHRDMADANGDITITYSSATTVTAALVQI